VDTEQIGEEVKGACEILGLDPLYVANEGKLLALSRQTKPIKFSRRFALIPPGSEAAIIGEVVNEHPGTVTMRTRVGGIRVVDMLSGEQLPRIC
jgi:hydrogenase expression/formation protein HypE